MYFTMYLAISQQQGYQSFVWYEYGVSKILAIIITKA